MKNKKAIVATTPFIHDDFLLSNKHSKVLYHRYASSLPIIDYHNHLSPKQLAQDTVFDNITKLWVEGDHYKWRAMRTLGIDEAFITGNKSDKEKFIKWGYTVPYTIGNPLFHWTHLELVRYFDEPALLKEKNAGFLFDSLSEKVNDQAYSTRKLVSKMNVEALCTTDDPIDSLEHHKMLAKSDFDVKASMSFRPDKCLMIEDGNFSTYVDRLGNVANIEINSYCAFLEAIKKRMLYFKEQGCRLSDHGLPQMFAEDFTLSEIHLIFDNRRKGKLPNKTEALKFKSAVLLFLGESYHELGWVQQYHLGPIRNVSSRLFKNLGPDTGLDSMGDRLQADALAKFFDKLDKNNKLAKTIIYNLNPADNALFATMIGNFNDGSVKGKVQWGSGWWFLDQKEGMEQQMKTLASMGLISCFVGMLTDSRSFMSFPRHEYFRRILCNFFGTQIQNGELPNDIDWIGRIVQDICYYNAKEYLSF